MTDDRVSATEPVSPRRVEIRIVAVIAVGAVVVYLLDQLAKAAVVGHLAVGQTVSLIGTLVQLHYVTNSGAAFSSFSGQTWVLSLVAIGVVAFIIWFARRIHSRGWAIVFGLVLGGALGNVTDRFVRPPGLGAGHVVDFIQVVGFPAIFNLADIAICAAMALFVVLTLRGNHLDGSRSDSRRREVNAGE